MAEKRKNNEELEKVNGSEPTMKQPKIEDFFEKWNNLPNEMKEECMQWMETKTRLRLRGTSKTEKEIVEALKFSVGTIAFKEKSLEIKEYNTSTIREDIIITSEDGNDAKIQNCIPLIAHLLNRCEIETLEIHKNCFLDGNVLEKLEELIEGEVKIKNLKSRDFGCEKAVFFLKKCKKIDALEVNVLYTAFAMTEFYSIPSVISAKRSLLLNPIFEKFGPVIEKIPEVNIKTAIFLQAFKQNDVKKGTRIRLEYTDEDDLDTLKSNLAALNLAGPMTEYRLITNSINPPKKFVWHTISSPTLFTMNHILVPSALGAAETIEFVNELYNHDKDILT